MSASARYRVARGVSIRTVLLLGFAPFAASNVLLPVFLGKPAIASLCALAAIGLLAMLWVGEARFGRQASIAWHTLAVCLAIACLLLLLGGQGRLFHANADWQVRDAVLADMARTAWPFVYAGEDGARLLRAPLGMYLLPALIGRSGQTALDLALLACNTGLLGSLFAIGSALFPDRRARAVALVVFVTFSGLDSLGTLIASASGTVSFDHFERWAPPLQYSSVVTLIFWVPQHAIAGWFCALLYLLHRRGEITLAPVIAAIPVAAIWSPLAIIGALPLVAWAGIDALRKGTLRPRDVGAGVLAVLLALPSLAYLAADARELPSGLRAVRPLTLAMFLALEVLPAVWIILRLRDRRPIDRVTLALVVVMLVLFPLFKLGEGEDFTMRASIAPLGVLALTVASGLTRAGGRIPRGVGIAVAAILAIGSVTGAAEIARALRFEPAPPPRCSLPGAWIRQSGQVVGMQTYLARSDAIPGPLRPIDPVSLDPRADPAACWARDWQTPRHD